MSFNWIDILLVLFILFSGAAGWRREFVLSFLDLVRWIGSLLAGLCFYRTVSGWFASSTDWTEVWNQPMAFILVVVVTSILIQILGNRFLRRIPKDVHERQVNRSLGTLPGLASGLNNKALIEIPPKFAGQLPVNPESGEKLDHTKSWKGAQGLAEDVRYYSKWMRDEAEKRIGHLYPKVKAVQNDDGSFRHATDEEIQNP